MQSVENNVAGTHGDVAAAEPITLLKRIGSTTFRVNVHFRSNSKETEDKILRLIEREVRESA